jgi:hypothetical protein
MSAEIDAVISSAIAGLNDGGSDGGTDTDSGDTGIGDAGGDVGTDIPAESGADESADAGSGTDGAEAGDSNGQPEPTAADVARAAEQEAWDKELEELGVARLKPGQKDNRMPHSRVSKVILNAKTKWSEKLTTEHKATLAETEKRIAAYEDYKKTVAGVEHLIENDPTRYLETLAQLYPQHYGKYAGGDAAKPVVKQDPEPQADIKYDDGSYGFSPEQFSKLREWDRREAARVSKEETTKEFNERFGGMEKDYKAVQESNAKVHQVRSDIDKLRDQWGADAIDNQEVQKAIVAHMDANLKDTLTESTRKVMTARWEAERVRLQADRTTMRTELLAELRAAPRAAAKAPNSPTKSDASGSESIEQIIASAMRGLK